MLLSTRLRTNGHSLFWSRLFTSEPRAATTIAKGRIRRRKDADGNGNDGSFLPPLVLHVAAGLGERSLVSQASESLFKCLKFKHELKKYDLWSDDLISYNVSHMAAKMRLLKGKGSPEDEELFLPVHRMAEELNAASVLVVSSPMWNFSFPYVLKQYVDIAVQPGINFHEVPPGSTLPSGARPITTDKHLVLVTSRGGSYGPNHPMDHSGPYLRSIFGMLGFTRAHELTMEGALHLPRGELLEQAAKDAVYVADIINADFCGGSAS